MCGSGFSKFSQPSKLSELAKLSKLNLEILPLPAALVSLSETLVCA